MAVPVAMPHPLSISPLAPSYRQGIPFSAHCDDRYWSERGNPCDEAMTVFIDANRLRQRWSAMKPNSAFFIGEIGFGTGLNFLNAWQQWQLYRQPGCRLHYLAFERMPLTPEAISKAHSNMPSAISALSAQLTEAGLPTTGGIHRLFPAPGSLWLTLAIGDAASELQQLAVATEMRMDCWFMDGFAPAKNPDAWSPKLAQLMAATSHRETTISSYSSARAARVPLIDAGFAISKLSGYMGKRERIVGQYQGTEAAPVSRPLPSVLIVGGGIAASACALSLSERGCPVTMVHNAAAAASDNPAGILRPRLTAALSLPRLHWNLSGWQLSLRRLHQLSTAAKAGNSDAAPASLFQLTGVLEHLRDGKSRRRAQKLVDIRAAADLWQLKNAEEASRLASLTLRGDWMYYPDAGWGSMAATCVAARASITLRILKDIALHPTAAGWHLISPAGELQADICLLASGNSPQGLMMQPEPITRVQPLGVPGRMDAFASCKNSSSLQLPLCGGGYIMPARDGMHWGGAGPTRVDNRQRAQKLLNEESFGTSCDAGDSWGAMRWRSPDGLPLVGASSAEENLYFASGLGARGLIFAFLAGEWIAAQIFAEPAPLHGKAARAACP